MSHGAVVLRSLAALLATTLSAAGTARAAETALDVAQLELKVAIVQDPDFPPLEPELARAALIHASDELGRRFGVRAPTLDVINEYTLSGFLGAYALPVDPACRPLYDARYRGGGATELARHKGTATKFLERWPLDSLAGFIPEPERASVKTHDDVYAYYVKKYVRTVEAMRGLRTPGGTPLVEPDRSARRSFVAWTCALLRQRSYDVILTNTFILADLMTEPHPHAVFGKAKIGGIAARSPARAALGGQALLATTFGIDTPLAEFRELPGEPPSFEERAKILGVYLLAHEIAHAVFGIPDVFDHPSGCLMTSRPGATYRDGLAELEANATPCPRCRPYVESRAAFDRADRLYREGQYQAASAAVLTAAKLLPQHFHGGRKKRMAQIMVIGSRAYRALGKMEQSRSLAQAARDLDPSSDDAASLLRGLSVASSSRTLEGTGTSTAGTSTRAR